VPLDNFDSLAIACLSGDSQRNTIQMHSSLIALFNLQLILPFPLILQETNLTMKISKYRPFSSSTTFLVCFLHHRISTGTACLLKRFSSLQLSPDLSIVFDMLPHPIHASSHDIHIYMSGSTRFRTFLDCSIGQLRDFIMEKVRCNASFAARGSLTRFRWMLPMVSPRWSRTISKSLFKDWFSPMTSCFKCALSPPACHFFVVTQHVRHDFSCCVAGGAGHVAGTTPFFLAAAHVLCVLTQ